MDVDNLIVPEDLENKRVHHEGSRILPSATGYNGVLTEEGEEFDDDGTDLLRGPHHSCDNGCIAENDDSVDGSVVITSTSSHENDDAMSSEISSHRVQSNCFRKLHDEDDDASTSTTETSDQESDNNITDISSQSSDMDNEIDPHVFVEQNQVPEEVGEDTQRMDQTEQMVVLELEPLQQRRCHTRENEMAKGDAHDDIRPDDIDDRGHLEGGVDDINDAAEPMDEVNNDGTNIFLAVKSVYFLLIGGCASLFPFLSAYLSYLGLDVIAIGKIRGLEPFIGMMVTPMCGMVADRFSRHKFMLLACLCGTVLVYGSSVFLPFLTHESHEVFSKHPLTKTGNYSFNMGVKHFFDDFFSQHPHVVEALNSCHFSDLSYSGFEEYVATRSCNFTNTEKRYGSTVTVLVEDVYGCSFINSAESSSIIQSTSGVFAPDVKCLFCADMMRACTYQYETTGFQKHLSIQSKDPMGNSSLTKLNDTSSFPGGTSKERNLLGAFVIMLMIVVVGELFHYTAVPLVDAYTMTLIDEYREKGHTFEYGRQRMWGGIAHGLLAPLSGLAVDAYTAAHPNGFNRYLPAFALFASLLALCVAIVSCMPIRAQPRLTKSFAKDAKKVLLKPKVIVFFSVMFLCGMFVGFIETYLVVFLAEIHGGATVMGLTLTATCAAEVPFMMFSSKLIDKFGHRGVIGIALIGYAVRFFCYSLLQNPWAVIPIELLHGVTFGSLWPASTSYMHLIAPADMSAIMQSLLVSIKGGLGKGLGAILGGVIYHHFGARNLFRGSAVLSLVTFVLSGVISLILDRREKSIEYDKL